MNDEKDELLLKKLGEFCDNLGLWVHRANNKGRPDSPARHFHMRTIDRLKAIGLESVFDDDIFLDYLYATLVTWGMDNRGARLSGCASFVETLRANRKQIIELGNHTLRTLNEMDVDDSVEISIQIWSVLSNLKICETRSQLVAGSKALHHLLPDLVPPVDRKYTLTFFLGRKGIRKPGADFLQVLRDYKYIYGVVPEAVDSLVGTNRMNTSITKVIDNAIIGYQSQGGGRTPDS